MENDDNKPIQIVETDDQEPQMTLTEAVRMRPAMYIGNDGAIGLFQALILAGIELCKSDEILFEITILGDNQFVFGLETNHDANPFWKSTEIDIYDRYHNSARILKILSSSFELKTISTRKSEIHFSFDTEVIKQTIVDFLKLSYFMTNVAVVNRNCEILTIDKRQKYTSQNYLHFPQGVFNLFDKATNHAFSINAFVALTTPRFQLKIEAHVNNNAYQIGLAYRTDWFPKPDITSYANDVHTVCDGSLVDGVMDGLNRAVKSHVKQNKLTKYKVKRKKFMNGLILVCAIRGKDLLYKGSFKESLADDTVKKEAEKLVFKSVSEFLSTNRKLTRDFLYRFDTTKLMSGMY